MILSPPPLWTPRRRVSPLPDLRRWRRSVPLFNSAPGKVQRNTSGRINRFRDGPNAGKMVRNRDSGNTCCCETPNTCCDSLASTGPHYAHVTVSGASACTTCWGSRVDMTGSINDTFTLLKSGVGCSYGLNIPYTAARVRWHDEADCSARTCASPVTCQTTNLLITLGLLTADNVASRWIIWAKLYGGTTPCTCCGDAGVPVGTSLEAYAFSSGFGTSTFDSPGPIHPFTMGACVDDSATVNNSNLCWFTDGAGPDPGSCGLALGGLDQKYVAFTGGTIAISLSDTP